jgi:hypothetical protein
MDDTPPEIYAKMNELYQKKTAEERFRMSFSMMRTARYFILRAILEENPNISKAGLKRELFLRLYKDDYTDEEKEKIVKHLEACTTDDDDFSIDL